MAQRREAKKDLWRNRRFEVETGNAPPMRLYLCQPYPHRARYRCRSGLTSEVAKPTTAEAHAQLQVAMGSSHSFRSG